MCPFSTFSFNNDLIINITKSAILRSSQPGFSPLAISTIQSAIFFFFFSSFVVAQGLLMWEQHAGMVHFSHNLWER